jgi:hypothetical protein
MSAREVADPREDPLTEKTKLVYIMGAGRSGSTILGVTLGNCPGVFFAGELDRWLPRAGVSPQPGTERAGFWHAVSDSMPRADDLFAGAASCLERSSEVFAPASWRRRGRLRGRYMEVQEALVGAIARVAGASHVVDSSHYPMRARELRRSQALDVFLVFLVRPPQSVVASFDRDDVMQRHLGIQMTTAYVWLTNFLSVLVFATHRADRRLLVYHEDFVGNPDAVMGDILRRIGASGPPADLGALKTGLAFHGNGDVLTQEQVALHAKPVRTTRRSRLTRAFELPFAAVLSRLKPVAARLP